MGNKILYAMKRYNSSILSNISHLCKACKDNDFNNDSEANYI